MNPLLRKIQFKAFAAQHRRYADWIPDGI